MDAEKIKRQLQFLLETDRMKNIERRNLIADGSRRENDAEHSWHLALFALVLAEYAPAQTDVNRAIRMAVVHDLVEVYAGDTFCYDKAAAADKKEREEAAARRLFGSLPSGQGSELEALWREFDEESTPDARYAAACDRLQPLLLNYKTQGHTWHLTEVHAADVYERLRPVREGMPALWDVVEFVVKDSVERGWLRP